MLRKFYTNFMCIAFITYDPKQVVVGGVWVGVPSTYWQDKKLRLWLYE